MDLIKNCFQLDVGDRQRIASQFQALGSAVASSLPIFRVRYPHRFDLIRQVQDAVLAVIADEVETRLIQ